MGIHFVFNDAYPLKELNTHWLATLIIILLVVSWIGFTTWRRVKKLEALKLNVELAVVDPIRHDIEHQNHYLDFWKTQYIKHQNGHTNAMYQHPWYFVLGCENCGKKSLINNSINTLDIEPTENIVSKHKLPLHLKCLLSNNAILLIPAGKLITQPNDDSQLPQRYHRLWQALLAWINKNRARQR